MDAREVVTQTCMCVWDSDCVFLLFCLMALHGCSLKL